MTINPGQNSHSAALPPDHARASVTRAVMLAVGAVSLCFASACILLLDREGGQFVLKATDSGRVLATLPGWWAGLMLIAIGTGGLGFLSALWKDTRVHAAAVWCRRWVCRHPAMSVLIAIAIIAGAIDVYELLYDPFSRERGLRPWMLREDLQAWLLFGAAIYGGLAISAISPSNTHRLHRFTQWLGIRLQSRCWWLVAIATPILLGAILCIGSLDGMPHFSDSLTYLMQGRILHAGRLWVPSPAHHELFQHSLFFVETDGRFFGKYPIGWPAILGTFDALHIGFLANAVMTGLAAVLTGLLAGEIAPRRVAVLAAVLFGLSPWVWFNGANFASHVSSTCAVTGFLWLFLRTLRTGSPISAIGAGLALGAGVLIRPFDAAMFALPAVFVVLVYIVRRPKKWIFLGPLIAVGAMVGVGVYLWVNMNTTGHPLTSAYSFEDRWKSDWNPSPLSMLGRLVFQYAELNSRFPGWGIGGVTVGVLGAIAAGTRWRHLGLWILTISSLLFFLASTAFGFTNVWWGPRWLAPMIPLLAILAAELVNRIFTQLGAPMTGEIKDHGATSAAQLAVCVLIAGLVVGLACRYSGQFYQHRVAPPHMVSAAVHQRVLDKGLTNAIVAMPPIGSQAPLDARAGMAFMGVPFEDNPVVYVRAIPGWRRFAAECFPGRTFYQIHQDSNDTKGFSIHAVQ